MMPEPNSCMTELVLATASMHHITNFYLSPRQGVTGALTSSTHADDMYMPAFVHVYFFHEFDRRVFPRGREP
jgi:hypothetical protein